MNHPFKTKFSIAKLVFRLVLLCMISGVLNPLSAQYIKSEVNRSTNIIMLDGKRYYLHEVKSGHTLYSIAKKYNVSEKLIGQENPVVRLGQIKNGQIIKIP
ncbi:MAG: LysM peptidoglycan-binding domain-containing protein, partial [Bacteroidetes bacterium]|nr:LysM peptidoglycan-binding domain-containing protein [Bacteroidota bacterium]